MSVTCRVGSLTIGASSLTKRREPAYLFTQASCILHDEGGVGPLVSPGGGLRRIGEDDMRVDALNSRGRLVHTDVSLHELGVGEALREAAAEPDRLAVADPASGRRLTYVELPAQSQRVAHGLPSAWPHLLPRQVGVSMALAAAQARSPPPTASTRRLRHPGCAGPGQLPSVSLRRR